MVIALILAAIALINPDSATPDDGWALVHSVRITASPQDPVAPCEPFLIEIALDFSRPPSSAELHAISCKLASHTFVDGARYSNDLENLPANPVLSFRGHIENGNSHTVLALFGWNMETSDCTLNKPGTHLIELTGGLSIRVASRSANQQEERVIAELRKLRNQAQYLFAGFGERLSSSAADALQDVRAHAKGTPWEAIIDVGLGNYHRKTLRMAPEGEPSMDAMRQQYERLKQHFEPHARDPLDTIWKVQAALGLARVERDLMTLDETEAALARAGGKPEPARDVKGRRVRVERLIRSINDAPFQFGIQAQVSDEFKSILEVPE